MNKRSVKSWTVYESFHSDGETGGREVHEPEGAFAPRATGVLDASGRMIYRQPERIGFKL